MNKFIVNGIKFNTGIPKDKIEVVSQSLLDLQYNKGNVIFQYNLINEKEIEFSFLRNLNYEISGDWISERDCSMISGLSEDAFEGDYTGENTPLVPMVVPYGTHWYTGIELFVDLYKQQLEYQVNQKTKKIDVNVTDYKVTVHIKFR